MMGLFLVLSLFGCGESPVAVVEENPITIQPRPVIHDPDNPNHLPDNAVVVEITVEELQAVVDAMRPAAAGSDPWYLFVPDATGEYTVIIKRIE